MLCFKPIDVDGRLVGCGQCMNCRINKQRVWSARIQLEQLFHLDSVFITLTYDEENVPRDPNLGDQILVKSDLRKFIKDMRNGYRSMNHKFRFFACGEYGSETQRPHYHVILFGVGLEAEQTINKTWGKGFTQVGELTPERASYIAQYTTKKLTTEGNPKLKGKPPEFATMSTRPGLGFNAVGWMANHIGKPEHFKLMQQYQDVFTAVRIGGKIWPLGQYLRRKLREALGLSNNARERAIQFDAIDRETGEIFVYADPLPENYHPWEDYRDLHGPWRKKHGKKAQIAELPNIENEAIVRDRKARKRKAITARV